MPSHRLSAPEAQLVWPIRGWALLAPTNALVCFAPTKAGVWDQYHALHESVRLPGDPPRTRAQVVKRLRHLGWRVVAAQDVGHDVLGVQTV